MNTGAGRRLNYKSFRKCLDNSGIQDGIFLVSRNPGGGYTFPPLPPKSQIFSTQGTWVKEQLPENPELGEDIALPCTPLVKE